MKYICLGYIEEGWWEGLSESQRDTIMDDYQALQQDFVRSGHYLAGAKLGATSAATTILWKNDKPTLTDGPFAETKEQIGGYHLIECRNLDEAMAIAKRIPTLPAGGTIEVRPVLQAITV